MTAYPRFFTLVESTMDVGSGVEPQRATNGRLHMRRLWTADKASFEVRHMLTAAERTTLNSFYAAERDADVTYTWPPTGETFTVRFVSPPQYLRRGQMFEARVRLEEV